MQWQGNTHIQLLLGGTLTTTYRLSTALLVLATQAMSIPVDPVVMSTESHGNPLSDAQDRSPGFHAQHRLVFVDAGISQACVHLLCDAP